MNRKHSLVGAGSVLVIVLAALSCKTGGEGSDPPISQMPRTSDGSAPAPARPSAGAPPRGPQQTTPEEPAKHTISLGQIVAAMNKATVSNPDFGTKFILHYEDGPFAVIDVNPALWESLSPLQQKAVGTNFANLFGGTGGINCRVRVYGVEVGHVSASVLGGWKYEPR